MTNLPQERVLLIVHKHWSVLLRDLFPLIIALCVGLVLFAVTRFFPASLLHITGSLALPLFLLILWMWVFPVWMTYYLSVVVLTDRRLVIIDSNGLADREVNSINLSDIAQVSMAHKGFFESYFGSGSITIETRTRSRFSADGLLSPEYLSAMIQREDNRYYELLDKAKQEHDLLRFVSHEIKGHLTKSKAAFASIVEGDFGPVSEDLQSLASEALHESQKGVETVMSLLDNRSAGGNMSYTNRPFDLSLVLGDLCVTEKKAVTAKGLVLNTVIDAGVIINGDAEKLSQHVLRNVIENAIRYTPKGSVSVSLCSEGGNALVEVADTGVGVDPSEQPQLFAQGAHGAHSKEVNPESTGYGLYVAKKVVTDHGGTISLYSEGAGKGTTVRITIPLQKV